MDPENTNSSSFTPYSCLRRGSGRQAKHSALNALSSILFYFSILFFTIGFNLSDRMAGNWYQQFMPNLGGQQINDIFFLDSLTGYAVASRNVNPDTASILKTTNGGDNWQIIFTQTPKRFYRIQFINQDTGFVCGGSGGGTPNFYRTTNGGVNWLLISTNGCALWKDMGVIDKNNIWLVDDNSLCGGVYYTSNGGSSWTNQLALGSQNPNHVYFYNGRLGFIAEDNVYLRRTSDGGANWIVIPGENGFTDMHFVDSLKGWKCSVFGMKKTTNGGLNWVTQTLPSGGIIQTNGISSFSNINKDTIWGNGGYVLYPNNQARTFLNRTTNQGDTWYFQIPDTTIHMTYFYVNFINKLNGWATDIVPSRGEIHTTVGGDTSFYLPVKGISTEIPKEFMLFQNYPNPFNPSTTIRFKIPKQSEVNITVYDIQGRKITVLVNKKLNAGEYETVFKADKLSSGVYFYSLFIDGSLVATKRMILVK